MGFPRAGVLVNRVLSPAGFEVRRKLVPTYLREFPIATILDVGANTGQFMQTARQVFSDAFIHCFEPLPAACARLRHIQDRDKKMAVHQFALGDEDRDSVLYESQFSPSSSLLPMTDHHMQAFPQASKVRERKVRVRRLDTWAATVALAGPTLVKLDVQGFEGRVLEGGERTIRNALALIVEVSFQELYESQLLFENVYAIVADLGFRCSGFQELVSDRRSGRPLQADAIFIHRSHGSTSTATWKLDRKVSVNEGL